MVLRVIFCEREGVIVHRHPRFIRITQKDEKRGGGLGDRAGLMCAPAGEREETQRDENCPMN